MSQARMHASDAPDYDAILDRAESLPWCALLTTGRVGSDFFQSLLDSHPEIFVFAGKLPFMDFWKRSVCVNYAGPIDPGDLADEFIGQNIWRLRTRYDDTERMDELGDNQDQSLELSIAEFRDHLVNLITRRPVSAKRFLQGIYISYALCLGQDVIGKRLFFHHEHRLDRVAAFLEEFPGAKIISMTRDPRAAYVSGVENWREYDSKTDTPYYPLYVLQRALGDGPPLARFGDDVRVLKLEDLGNERIKRSVCDWLGVSYDPCLQRSTRGGLRWWGDRLSQSRIARHEVGYSAAMTKNNWEGRLGTVDKVVLDYLLGDRLRWYGYPCSGKSGAFHAAQVLLALALPTVYERRFMSPRRIVQSIRKREFKYIPSVFYHYGRRVLAFYRMFKDRRSGRFVGLPYFR